MKDDSRENDFNVLFDLNRSTTSEESAKGKLMLTNKYYGRCNAGLLDVSSYLCM